MIERIESAKDDEERLDLNDSKQLLDIYSHEKEIEWI